MHRNRRSRRAFVEIVGLAVLLVVAVRVWNGPAAIQSHVRGSGSTTAPPFPPPRYSASPTAEIVAHGAANGIPTAPARVALSDWRPNEEQESPTLPEMAIWPANAAVARSSDEDGNQLGSPIRARFWDGVVEFGYRRRTIALVGNEVDGEDAKLAHPGQARPSTWPHADALIKELDTLASPAAIAWGKGIRRALSELEGTDWEDQSTANRLLTDLEYWVSKADAVAGELSTVEEQYRVRHAMYSLQRRLEVWRAVALAARPETAQEVRRYQVAWNADAMARELETIQQWLPSIDNGLDWMAFLNVEGFSAGITTPASQQHVDLARTTLAQIDSAKLTSAQRTFLETPVLAAYRESLQQLAVTPADFPNFLQCLEGFETSRNMQGEARLVQAWNEIRRVPVADYQQVAAILNLHYRNANIRVSMTEDFANRFLPAVQHARAPVREQLLGADVQGLSDTLTKLHIRFVPDPDQIRIKLEATGQLASQTQSTKGPITLFNSNRSRFIVQKLFTLNPQGMRVGRTKAEATASTNLMGVRTRYDGMPMVGNMVRRIARQKHHDSKPLTHRVLRDLTALRVRQRLDAQLDQQMVQARQRLDDSLIQPLEEMNLSPEAIAMQTTADRLVIRGRLAGEMQLAAYTARPQASAENLLSVQLHESALNNFLDQMELGGRYVEVRTLIREILDKWGLRETPIPEDLPEGVKLEMASFHPIVVRCDQDRIQVEIAVKRLSDEFSERTWQNFMVRVHFVPSTEGFSCELHRDGVVQLQSLTARRLSNRDQFALRAIFGRVFSKNHPLRIVTPDLNEDPRLRELNVDQFVIRDGWIGISVAESGVTQLARQPKSSDAALQ